MRGLTQAQLLVIIKYDIMTQWVKIRKKVQFMYHRGPPKEPQRARKFKKVQAKKLVISKNQKVFFVKLHFWQFQTISQFKN